MGSGGLPLQGSGEAEQVIGGAACEVQRASGCVLCTCLYVLDRPELRQRGRARALLEFHAAPAQDLSQPVGT